MFDFFATDLFEVLVSFAMLMWLVAAVVLVIGFVLYQIGILGKADVIQGTGVAFLAFNRFVYSAMERRDNCFDRKGFIVPRSGPWGYAPSWLAEICTWLCIWRILGMVFYIKWIVTPADYSKFNDEDGFGEAYRVRLGELLKVVLLSQAETKGNIPVDLAAFFRMRIVNLYLFLFEAPRNAVEQTKTIMEALLRKYVVRKFESKDLQEKDAELIWQTVLSEPECRRKIQELHDKWGIEIVPQSIELTGIGYSEEDQKALGAKKREAWKAEGDAEELMGSFLAIAAKALNVKDGEAARLKLKRSAKGRRQLARLQARAIDASIQRKVAQAGGIVIPGLKKMVADAVAAFMQSS